MESIVFTIDKLSTVVSVSNDHISKDECSPLNNENLLSEENNSTLIDEDSKTKNEKRINTVSLNRALILYDQVSDISSAVEMRTKKKK